MWKVRSLAILENVSLAVFPGPGKDRLCPVDILIPNWSLSRSAAFDIKVRHPLNNPLISETGQTSGASAAAAEQKKHQPPYASTTRGTQIQPLSRQPRALLSIPQPCSKRGQDSNSQHHVCSSVACHHIPSIMTS